MDIKTKTINEKVELHVINLESLSDKTQKLLNDNIVQICEGDSENSASNVKERLLKFLSTKDERTCLGAIAEFLIHLYLREKGFKQEFLFFNLEEGSIKKGFDGYYSQNKEEYILESKSGKSATQSISHTSKLKEAYNDVKSYIEGTNKKSTNNPWRNAYNHASHVDVGSSKSIRNKLSELSVLFDSGVFKDIKDFNVIPCSTIFLNGTWSDNFSNKVLTQDPSNFDYLNANKTKLICVTKNSKSNFENYLKARP